MISDEKWELKIFQVWTVPVDGRVKYNILVFQVVGVMVLGCLSAVSLDYFDN